MLELGRLRFASNREACAGIQPYPLAVLDSDYRAFKDAHIHSDALTELATLVEPEASAHTEVRRPTSALCLLMPSNAVSQETEVSCNHRLC